MTARIAMAPDAVEVRLVGDYLLRVRFDNGEWRDFDAKAQLLGRKCYAPLRNPTLFQTARVAYGTVVWTDELDIDPEWLYEESIPVR